MRADLKKKQNLILESCILNSQTKFFLNKQVFPPKKTKQFWFDLFRSIINIFSEFYLYQLINFINKIPCYCFYYLFILWRNYKKWIFSKNRWWLELLFKWVQWDIHIFLMRYLKTEAKLYNHLYFKNRINYLCQNT